MKRIWIALLMCLLLLQGCDKVPENTIHSMEDLKGKEVGVQLKTTGDECASKMDGVNVQRFNRIIDAVSALRDGEMDAVILDEGTANAFVKEYKDVEVLGTACEGEQYGIVIKKGNIGMRSKIDYALRKIKENGTLDSIVTQWMTEDPKESVYKRTKSAPFKNGKVVVVTNAEFPPFESVLKGKLVGIDIDIMNAICDEMDVDLEIQDIAFDSVISYVDKGMADIGISAMSITDARKELVDFSESYLESKQVVLIRK